LCTGAWRGGRRRRHARCSLALAAPIGSRSAAPTCPRLHPAALGRRCRGRGAGEDTVLDEEERNTRLEAYTRQARASVCRIAEDGRTEVGLELEHDGRWFRTIDHLPGEDVSDEAIEPVVARRARQIAAQSRRRGERRRERM